MNKTLDLNIIALYAAEEEAAKLEKLLRELRRKETWNRAEYEEKRRLAGLDALVPDRVCPVCSKVKIRSRSWLVLRHRHIEELRLHVLSSSIKYEVSKALKAGIVCRSCAMGVLRRALWVG